MRTINQSTKLGFVGAKPELRATTSGVSVASFSLATSELGALVDGTHGVAS